MYVFSEWRSTRLVEINQYDKTMATYYDITMGNDVAKDDNYELNIPTQLMCSPQTDQTLTCSCYNR